MGKSTMTESLVNFKLYFCCFYILFINVYVNGITGGSDVDSTYQLFQTKCENGQCVSTEYSSRDQLTCRNSDETQEQCGRVMCSHYTRECNSGACHLFLNKCDDVKKTTCAAVFDDPNIFAVHAYDTSIKVNDGELIEQFREIIYKCSRTYVLYGVRDNLCLNGEWRYPIPQCSIKTPDGKTDVTLSSTQSELENSTSNADEVSLRIRMPDAESMNFVIDICFSHITKLMALDPNNSKYIEYFKFYKKLLEVCSPVEIEGVTFSTKCKFNQSETSCTGLIQPKTRVDITCSVGYRKPLYDIPEILQCRETGEWDYRPASCVPECGKLAVTATPFVSGGMLVNITKVPWHTAIYKSDGKGNYGHICGGTIYSAKLVISAAHCFWDVRRDIAEDKRLYTVGVGKVYRSYNAFEPLFTQFFNLSEIHIPVSYGDVGRSYENDIAMLVLDNYIVYKDHIKPICIRWFQYSEREVKPGTVGRIAGWGKININNDYGEDLKAVDLPAFSKEQCLKDDATYKSFVTGEKFCVGAPDDESVCEGDSGGGYVVKNEVSGTYDLWGVLSVGLGRTCERDHLTTFTNIQYHKDMITDYEFRFRPK